jgi:hypothetical protein
LPERQIALGQKITFYGMRYVAPVIVEWPGTVVAVNVGGALIPGLMSLYLLVKQRLWVRGFVAVTCVAAVCYQLARPVPGLGVALPVFVPAVVAALVALLLSRRDLKGDGALGHLAIHRSSFPSQFVTPRRKCSDIGEERIGLAVEARSQGVHTVRGDERQARRCVIDRAIEPD